MKKVVSFFWSVLSLYFVALIIKIHEFMELRLPEQVYLVDLSNKFLAWEYLKVLSELGEYLISLKIKYLSWILKLKFRFFKSKSYKRESVVEMKSWLIFQKAFEFTILSKRLLFRL